MPVGSGKADIQMQPAAPKQQTGSAQFQIQPQAQNNYQVNSNGTYENGEMNHAAGSGYSSDHPKEKPVVPFAVPRFLKPLESNLNMPEGETLHLETQVTPAEDNSLRVEWYKNGNALITGSRFNAFFERGYAALDILYTFVEDSGDYVCVAYNKSGQEQSNVCKITILEEDDTIAQRNTELLAAQNLHDLEALHTKPKYDREDHETVEAPKFVKPVQVSNPHVAEGEPVHFETCVTPSGDSSLQVEWFKNGQHLLSSCRFNFIYDRGFAIFDIAYCIADDQGDYFCVAKNNLGQAQSNVAHLECIIGDSIVTKSNLSEDSIQNINYLENPETDHVHDENEDFRYQEEQEIDSLPVFDVKPQSCQAEEGGPAQFLVRVTGFPRPRITWFVNGDVITSNNTYKIYHDGAINVMKIFRCKDVGELKIVAIAKNTLGEAFAEATLNIIPTADMRPGLKHIQPDNNFKRMQQLRKVDCTPELNKALCKPKPTFEQLRGVERDSEIKARTFTSPEVLEAENLYASVQAHLHGGGYGAKQQAVPTKPQPNAAPTAKHS